MCEKFRLKLFVQQHVAKHKKGAIWTFHKFLYLAKGPTLVRLRYEKFFLEKSHKINKLR